MAGMLLGCWARFYPAHTLRERWGVVRKPVKRFSSEGCALRNGDAMQWMQEAGECLNLGVGLQPHPGIDLTESGGEFVSWPRF
jgi:hypothetical protein